MNEFAKPTDYFCLNTQSEQTSSRSHKMKAGAFILVAIAAATITLVAASSIPAEEVLLQHNPLEHDSLQGKHFDGAEHNPQFDHEAFLGADEAKKFDDLTPEESKRRLGLIVDRIDEDKDGFISQAELKNWISYTQRRYIDEDVGRLWRQHNPENNTSIPWEAYRKGVYGFMDSLDKAALEEEEHGKRRQYLVVPLRLVSFPPLQASPTRAC